MDGSGHTEPGGARDVPALVRLATRQHNAVSRSQLSELQFDRKSVARLVERGWAHPAYRSVYAIGRDRLDLHGRMVAGNLLGGPRSAVVRHGAAWLHGIGDEPSLVEVIAPRKVTVRSDICFHRSTQLREDECMEVAGVRVTTIERTLIDLADVLTPDQLAHVMFGRTSVIRWMIDGFERSCAGTLVGRVYAYSCERSSCELAGVLAPVVARKRD